MPEKLKENLYNYPNNPNPINPDYPLEAILTEAHMQNTITSDMVSIVAAKGKIPIGNPEDSYKLDSSWLGIDPDASYAVDATTTRKGIIEIATEAEAKTGTDTERAVTPAGVKASILQNTPKATTAQSGVVTLTNLIDNSQDKAVTPYAIQNYLSSSNFSKASYTGYGITKFASTTNVAKVLTDSATKPINTLKNDTNYKEQAVDPYSLYNYVSNNTMYFNVNKQSVGGIIFRDLSEDDTATRVTATERARLYVNKDNGNTYLKVNGRTATLLDNAGNSAFPVSITASTSVITPLIKQSNGNAPKLGTKKIGDTNKPIYIASDGTISECNNIDTVNNATNATNATNADKAIKDGNGNIITSTYLPLAGGTMTGPIKAKTTFTDANGAEKSHTYSIIDFKTSGTTAGNNVAFGGNSNAIFGSGESFINQLNALDGVEAEDLYLVSDGNIHVKMSENNFANCREIFIDKKYGQITTPSNILTKSPAVVRGTAPSSNIEFSTFDFRDCGTSSGNHRIGLVSTVYKTDKSSYTGMYAYDTTVATGNSPADWWLGIGCDKNAKVYTHAPTPAATSNDTNIATTAFVKTAISNNNSSYLPLAGGTMTGQITSSVSSAYWVDIAAKSSIIASNNTSGAYGWLSGYTKSYRVMLGAYPGNDEMIQLYSYTKARASAGGKTNNTPTSYFTWNAATGEIRNSGGATLSSTLNIAPGAANNYSEGIRIQKATNNWATIVLGCKAGTVNGNPATNGGWFIGNNTSNQLVINNTDSSTGKASIWIDTDKKVTMTGACNVVGTITQNGTAVSLNGHTHSYAASNHSHSDYLPLAGGTMTGNITRKNTSVTRGTAPSSNQYMSTYYQDSKGNAIGCFESGYYKDKSAKTGMYTYNTTVASGGSVGSVGVGCDKNGNVYTWAPTPASGDNSTKIATTAFVKSALASVKDEVVSKKTGYFYIGDVIIQYGYYNGQKGEGDQYNKDKNEIQLLVPIKTVYSLMATSRSRINRWDKGGCMITNNELRYDKNGKLVAFKISCGDYQGSRAGDNTDWGAYWMVIGTNS